MQTQAYFDDIQLHILRELKRAKSSIHIAVAWFTDPDIFAALCQKAQAGVRVELITFNDGINCRSGIKYDQLNGLGGLFLMVGDKKRGSAVMHNKFCVIDGSTVITGSYNWSRQAKANYENITVISNHPELAQQFLQEFETMIERCVGAGTWTVDQGKILQRMEALRQIIELEDEDDISLQVAKLKKLLPDGKTYPEVTEIISLVEGGNCEQAIPLIVSYSHRYKQVAVYTDPEIPELKLELKALEMQIGSLENEKTEIEKLLYSFHHQHAVELGGLIRKLLKLREEKLKSEVERDNSKQEKYEEARRDATDYEEDYQETIQQEMFTLTSAEQQEMKAIYRACTKMCHPDVVAEEFKSDASRLFAQLAEANIRNDIQAVSTIFEDLKAGIFKPLSETIGDAQKLHQVVVRFRTKLKDLSREIFTLRTSESYMKVSTIPDLDTYFSETKSQLFQELAALESAHD
jgi:PLD-like domain